MKNLIVFTFFVSSCILSFAQNNISLKSFEYGGYGDTIYAFLGGKVSVFEGGKELPASNVLVIFHTLTEISDSPNFPKQRSCYTDSIGSFAKECLYGQFDVEIRKPNYQTVFLRNYEATPDQFSSCQVILYKGDGVIQYDVSKGNICAQEDAGKKRLYARVLGLNIFNSTQLYDSQKKYLNSLSTNDAALNKLFNDADFYLKDTTTFSVVSKKQISPSGDIHDYISMAPYWFPDSTKANGLPYIRKDGQRNPEGKNYTDKERLNTMCKRVTTLSLASYISHKRIYAEKAKELLKVWFLDSMTRMNPNLQYSQFIKGKNDGRGAGILDGREFVYLLESITILDQISGIDIRTKLGLQAWFSDYFTWLNVSPNAKAERMAKNNHGSWFTLQYAQIAEFVGKKDSAKTALQSLKDRIAWQIEPDGTQPLELIRTKSLSYSIFNLKALCDASLLSQNELYLWGFETKDGRSIKKALDYILPFAMKPETWKGKQIAKVDMEEVYALLRIGAAQYPNDKQYQIWEEQMNTTYQSSIYNLIY